MMFPLFWYIKNQQLEYKAKKDDIKKVSIVPRWIALVD